MVRKLRINENYGSDDIEVKVFLSPNNRGFYDGKYFDVSEWSDVESMAHDYLMQGFYVTIINNKTGDRINIDPDEYVDNFDGEFDVTNDIADFKYRIMHESRCNRNRKSKYFKEEYVEPSVSYDEFRKDYKWSLKKYPNIDKFYDYYDDVCGTVTETHYTKVGTQWKKTDSNTESFTGENYMKYIESVPFFRRGGQHETVKTCYTTIGNIPCEISAVMLDRRERIVWSFRFDFK
jgi:hypothetical protein